MNKSIKILMAITLLLSFTACNAQIKNAKTESVNIYGNCGMCESAIEKAGNIKNVAQVDWNKDTKMATLTYDQIKTNQDEILKRIALAGYDSDQFLAPNDVYAKLPESCKYERKTQTITKVETTNMDTLKVELKQDDYSTHNHSDMTETKQEVPQLKSVFDNYFALKDALVKTDGTTASTKANELLTAINSVKMDKLTTEEHIIWMKVMKDLTSDVEHIADTKEISHQRDHFATLSEYMYPLAKVSKQETPSYFQHCPMYNDSKGANWLSKEKTIKNPYYGSQMLACGSTVETIK
jgi:copper chaperone CopZ